MNQLYCHGHLGGGGYNPAERIYSGTSEYWDKEKNFLQNSYDNLKKKISKYLVENLELFSHARHRNVKSPTTYESLLDSSEECI